MKQYCFTCVCRSHCYQFFHEAADRLASYVALQLELDYRGTQLEKYGEQYKVFFEVLVWNTGLFSAYLEDGTSQHLTIMPLIVQHASHKQFGMNGSKFAPAECKMMCAESSSRGISAIFIALILIVARLKGTLLAFSPTSATRLMRLMTALRAADPSIS